MDIPAFRMHPEIFGGGGGGGGGGAPRWSPSYASVMDHCPRKSGTVFSVEEQILEWLQSQVIPRDRIEEVDSIYKELNNSAPPHS